MITTAGARWIRQFMSQQVETIAESVAFGIGSTTATVNDTDLEYEVLRGPVTFRSYDPNTGEVVFRVEVPTDQAARITEIGLWANASDNDGTAESQTLVDFNEDNEPWTLAASHTFIANSRIGDSALNIEANGTSTLVTDGLSLDMFGGQDQFALAIGPVQVGSATLNIRFRQDADNYFSFSTTVNAGGVIKKFTKSEAVRTGNPSWDTINDIQFIVSGLTSGGSFRLEGLRVLNSENALADYVLVARQTIAPFQTDPTKTTEFELRIGTTIT